MLGCLWPFTEVEATIKRLPEVHDTAAILQDAGEPTAALIAYVSPASVNASSVASACAERLPHYMVPAAVVCLDAMPYLSNGKVNACLALDTTSSFCLEQL